jgi:hypothetical protein
MAQNKTSCDAPVKQKSHGDLVLMAENQTPCDALICEDLVAESYH